MKKRLLLWAVALFPLASCSLLEVAALNPNFLDPLHGLLFKNEFQVNDPQYLFDTDNKTVSVKTRGNSTTKVDGIYSLELMSNPSSSQGIYRMIGSKNHNNFFLGLEYTQAGEKSFRAKIVIQESELKTKDALNTLSTAAYVNASLGSASYYKVAAAGTWARVSASGIYNSAFTDWYTFIYNELVDAGGNNAVNAMHTLRVENISGTVATSQTYNLTLLTNISVSSGVLQSTHASDGTAPLNNRYIGYHITNLPGGRVFAKIITSSSATIDNNSLMAFIEQMNNSAILDYTTRDSVERPDIQLLPLRSKGPWVFVKGNVYDLLDTTNWDFSVQDQAVTITVFSSPSGTAPLSQSHGYSLRTSSTPSVFRLSALTPSAPFNNQYFGFKFRTRPGDTIERASFYIEASEGAVASRIADSDFADNYVNIYDASTLGGGNTAADYKLKINSSLPATLTYQNILANLSPLFGATLFTREDAGKEFIYVVGGAETTQNILDSNFSLFELISAPTGLRRTIARTSTLGATNPLTSLEGWEDVNFRVSGYPSTTDFVAPFGGLYGWVGSRLFIYNPIKFSSLVPFTNIPSSYRVISTTFSGDWAMAALPSSLTNRAHASFFSSQGVLVLAGGMHFTENSHTSGGSVPRGNYIITNDIWQSYNGGSTWSQVSSAAGFSPRYMATTLNVGSDVFLMGGYTAETVFSSEIWKSTDNGATWAMVTGGTLPTDLVSTYSNHSKGRAPGFVINNMMYLVAANETAISSMTTPIAIYSSRDGGKTWVLESEVDTMTGGGTSNRAQGIYASGYVWSPNNSIHKGVLFSIGGFPQGATSINSDVFRRVLEK